MQTAIIALKLADEIPSLEGDYIGVDRGALAVIHAGLPLKLAVGDFDSVNASEFQTIQEHAQEIIKLNPIKDDSDSESAMHAVFARGYDTAVMIGAVGGRMDHALVNLRLAVQNPGRVILLDEQNLIKAYTKGTYHIKKDVYSYISFFTESEAEITISGMKYPLEHRHLHVQDLYTVSNEITAEEGILEVHSGTVLVIQSKDA